MIVADPSPTADVEHAGAGFEPLDQPSTAGSHPLGPAGILDRAREELAGLSRSGR
jgi:hypothetical protein